MNAPAIVKSNASALALTDDEMMDVLENSLYPGARPASIKMIVNYCRAAGLDPLQKPVHIVPMSVKIAGKKDEYEWRDVVMPGIGLYRTQAARSGQYAGVSEPEYGEDVSGKVGDVEITYPKWCKVTVRRRIGHDVDEYTAKEFWKENYATAGKNSISPNSMWKRRPYAQLAKCAEAQALRKAFPEVGAQPTADEMEGKALDEEFIDADTGEVTNRRPAVTTPVSKSKPKQEKPSNNDAEDIPLNDKTADDSLATVGEVAYITKKITSHGLSISDARVAAGLSAAATLDGLTKDGFIALKDSL